jgi:hypothetical protein
MKTYPSIPRTFQAIPECHIFDKLDGSNIRVEWSKKAGFYKFGRRTGLLDDSNPHLQEVPAIFAMLEEDFARLALKQRWQFCTFFFEFWGERSVAGLHYEGDPKRLTLIDAAPNKKGILPPKDFRKVFEGEVDTPKYLGRMNWNKQLVQRVRDGELEGVSFEGIVGKAGNTTHKLVRAKAKTQEWIDKVYEIHGHTQGDKLVNS